MSVAVDRVRLAGYLWGFLAGEEITEQRIIAAISGAFRDGYAADAAAVRREHGERIAEIADQRAIDADASGTNNADNDVQRAYHTGAAGAFRDIAFAARHIPRDLSQADALHRIRQARTDRSGSEMSIDTEVAADAHVQQALATILARVRCEEVHQQTNQGRCVICISWARRAAPLHMSSLEHALAVVRADERERIAKAQEAFRFTGNASPAYVADELIEIARNGGAS